MGQKKIARVPTLREPSPPLRGPPLPPPPGCVRLRAAACGCVRHCQPTCGTASPPAGPYAHLQHLRRRLRGPTHPGALRRYIPARRKELQDRAGGRGRGTRAGTGGRGGPCGAGRTGGTAGGTGGKAGRAGQDMLLHEGAGHEGARGSRSSREDLKLYY